MLVRVLLVVLASAAFLVWDRSRDWSVVTNPDSVGYVHNEETRGQLYPLLIDLVVPAGEQRALDRRGLDERAGPVFERLVLVQRLFLLAALALTCWVTSRRGVLVPIALVGGAALFHFLLAPDLFTGLARWLASVNPEALVYPWQALLFLLAWTAAESPRRWRLLALGVWAALGVEIAPRLLPFCLLTLAPPLAAWIGRKSGARPGAALLAAGACAVLLGLRCSFTYAEAGVLAPVPYNGFSTIGVALQFADAGDERLFAGEREQDFVRGCLADERRRPSDPVQGNTYVASFVNTNTWIIAWPAYKRIWRDPGTDRIPANRVLAAIARTLLFEDGDNLRRWTSWASRAWMACLALRWPTTVFALACLVLAFVLRKRAAPAHLALLVLLPAAHVANIVLTVTMQGILARYVVNGEFLLLGACAVLAAAAVDRTPLSGSPAKPLEELALAERPRAAPSTPVGSAQPLAERGAEERRAADP